MNRAVLEEADLVMPRFTAFMKAGEMTGIEGPFRTVDHPRDTPLELP